MARRDINIGLTGNDGTGDSIRDAFSKVNSNFQELYASQGLEAGLTFDNLVDVVKPLRPNTVLGLDTLGKNVISRDLIGANGVSIDATSDPSQVVIGISGIDISDDPNPTLSNDLNANGFRLTYLAAPTSDQDATTRKWVYENFLNRDNIDLLASVPNTNGSFMRQNFRIQPTPDNGNPNVGDQIIRVKGSDGVTNKIDVFLKYQGTAPAHATRKDYVDTKLSLQGTETLDPATGLVNQGFGVMTGPLILNDHPTPYGQILRRVDGTLYTQADYRAVTKGYVDSNVYNSPSNLYVSTIGNDDMWDFVNDRPNPLYGYPEKEIGRSWAKAFKSLRAAAKFAKKYIDRVQLQNVPYQVSPAQIQRWQPPFTTPLSSPRTRVRVSITNHGFVDGDYVQVAGAVLGSLDTRNLNGIHRVNKLDDNNFELDLKSLITWPQPEVAAGTFITMALANKKDGPYSTLSKVTLGFRGFFVPKPEITIMIESGVYYEDFPILIPPNVAVKGDEFRRTLIRPKQGPVLSENQQYKFLRGDRSLGADFWYNQHYYHQLARSVGSTNVVGSSRLEVRSAAYAPKPGVRFIWGATGGQPDVYRVGSIKNIIFKPTDDANNIAPGTYIMDIVDDNGDPLRLKSSIPDGSTIEFLLDNEHCDMLLVSDAFQARNVSFLGSKGFAMAFDPTGQVKTRSPYAQVCATFAGEGGGGQYIDGMSGNQVCYVTDNSYTDPFTGIQGATGLKLTVRGLLRRPEIPNTFYLAKKRYVLIDSTTPDALTGTATLTLSSATPIEADDTYLPAGFIPSNTQLLIETAGNRSMLSNDFTMVNDLGFGLFAENNGVAEAVSQFTYYCRVSYLAKSGAQLRTVTGSSCYGLIGLQSEGSDPNEAIQIGRIKATPVNIVTPYIDNPLANGNVGAVSFIVGGADNKPLRNSTFKLNKHEIVIKDIQRARLGGGTVTDDPLIVTTAYTHPFVTGDSVQMTTVKGLELPPVAPSTTNRTTDIDGRSFTITVTGLTTFTLNTTVSSDYVNDLGEYDFGDSPARAISNFVVESQDVVYTVKGDPSPRNILGFPRFDGASTDNKVGQTVLKVKSLQRPAVVGMKFTLNNTSPAINESNQIYKVTQVTQKIVTFKPAPRTIDPQSPYDNKIGSTVLYITEVISPAGVTPITDPVSPWAPKAGWSFQLLDTNLAEAQNYDRYTVTGTPTYDAAEDRWALTLDVPLTVNMINQVASAQFTLVDGFWDLTLDRALANDVPSSPVTTFTFTDSYWLVNIDPSLAVRLPYTVDVYNKIIPKRFNLYQLKTVSVSQILNTPPIINSSAVRFSSSNYDPSIYRILGKTSDGGITKDVYPLLETATPLSGYNVVATEKLLANKEFIQQEVVDYLATIYPDFVYEVATCYRDVGYILDAVIYDLTYGGNVRSRGAGISYYQQGNPSAALVLSSQKDETIDAINFATTVAQTALNQYTGSTSIQLALPYRGSNLNGVAQLLANKEFIQDDVIAYLSNTYPGFNYDEEKCKRDVDIIVNAVLDDVILGTNYRSVTAGLAYLRSYSSTVLINQKSPTIAGINKAKELSVALITDPDTISNINTRFNAITSIIDDEDSNLAPSLILTEPLNVDENVSNAVDLITVNKAFIQAETVAYLQSNFIGYTYTQLVQDALELDIDLILNSAVFDMVFGTNYNSVRTARAKSSYLQSEQNVQTVEGIRQAKQAAQTLVTSNATALSRITSAFDQVINALNGSNVSSLTFPTPTGATQNLINAKDQLVQNKTFIQAEILAFVNSNTPPVGYDQAKFSQDVGYMVDALCYDILYGGNSALVELTKAYFSDSEEQQGTGDQATTVASYSRLQVVVGEIVQGTTVTKSTGNTSTQNITGSFATSTEASSLSTLIAITKDAVTNGNLNTVPPTSLPTITSEDAGLQTALSDILDASTTIKATVSDYVTDSFSGKIISPSACSRDVGYIVDALTYDLLYGGNSQTVEAGKAYYFGTSSFIDGQEAIVALVYTHMQAVVDSIIQAIAITRSSGNTATQNIVLDAGTVSERNKTTTLIQYIVDIVEDGVGAAPVVVMPAYSNGINYINSSDEKTTILNNLESIKTGVISYLNTTFSSGFSYNQTKCRRDVGYIIDAIAYDLEYNSNVKTRTAALKYYNGDPSSDVVIEQQKSQTVAALNHASSIAQLVVLEQAVTRQSGNIQVQNTSGTPGTSGVDNTRVQALMNILVDIVQNGIGQAPVRDLGIRRSYQNPAGSSYKPQVINNSLTSESGAGFRVGQLMNQITSIIRNGSSGTHILIESQVLDTLQTLKFPPTATSLQYGGVLTGTGIPTRGVNGVTEDTIIRTVTQNFDSNQNSLGYTVRISSLIATTIPAGTEITITGPGSDFLFDLNTGLDSRHMSGEVIGITTTFSTVRATGHDFLQVGAGGYDDSNYPNNVYGPPVNTPTSGALAVEVGTGRVFHVSTDQDGNFRVGNLFAVNQGDGSVSINAPIGLAAVSSLSFLTGETVRAFSADTKLDDNSDNIVPTQKAIKTYINNLIGGRFTVDNTETPNQGLMTLDGDSVMVGDLDVGLNKIENIVNSAEINGGVNRKYVDNVFAGGTINYDGSFEITTTGVRTDVQAFAMISDNTTSGGVPANRGGIDLNGNQIIRLKAPNRSTDATNKLYVDTAIAIGGQRTGWAGFTLNDTVTRYYVNSINLVAPGAGYTTPPVVVFYSTSGAGASARAILAAGSGPRAVNAIVLDTPGYGYTDAPAIIIGGSVANVDVSNPGTGYSSTPTITFSPPQLVGGITATGYAVMEGASPNLRINRIIITNAGAGYTSNPTITQAGGSPASSATFSIQLQVGSGASASAIMTVAQRNIDLNGNRATGSADPINPTDLVNLRYFDEMNFLDKMSDVTISNTPGSGEFLVFTGEVPPGSAGSVVNAAVSTSSDVTVTRENNSITISIKPGTIQNADVSTSAGIVQSKLSLNRSRTVAASGTPGADDFGITAFLDSQFTINNGFVQLRQSTSKTDGVTFDRVQQMTNYRVLGRLVSSEGPGASGVIQELDAQAVKDLINLSPATVSGLISDDTLGGLLTNGSASGLAARGDGSTSYGALLKRGGTMRGKITLTANGLPAGDPLINPILAVGADDNEKFDIGASGLRFRITYSKTFTGDSFIGTTFGGASAPSSINSGAAFNGTATFSQTAGQLPNGISGTDAGSGDIAVRNGGNNVTFNGSQSATISILADSGTSNNSIVRRTSTGAVVASSFSGGNLAGGASWASNLRSGTTDYAPTSAASGTGVPLMINGTINGTLFSGNANYANYKDLAENYVADKQYEPGTVLEFGGEFEVTLAEDETRRVAGVVSTDPAYWMGKDMAGEFVVPIALQGRVPCKVRGIIRKGDMMISAGGGYARPTNDPKMGTIIGKALQNWDGGEGVIEVVVGRL